MTIGHYQEAAMGVEERRQREKEKRRSAILKATRKLSIEKGFKSITVANIAKKAELSKGAVYLYFNSKEEIYVQILLNDLDKFHSTLSDICENGGAAADMLNRFSDIYIDFFLADRELFKIFTGIMTHTNGMDFPEPLNNQLIQATNATMDIIAMIFKYGVDRGEFLKSVNIRLLRNAVWGLLNGILALHLFTGKESKREQKIRSTVRASLDVLLAGLSRAGVKNIT